MSAPTESPDVGRDSSRTTETEPPGQAFGESMRLLAELRAYVSYYISSRIDQLRLTIRSFVLWAAFLVIGLIAAGAVVVMAVVQVLGGIAGGIAQLAPSHPWIGSLITGIVMLGVVFFAVRWSVGFIRRASHAAIVAKYEAIKREQRQQFGRSVDDGAN
jgi:hypothetical protein